MELVKFTEATRLFLARVLVDRGEAGAPRRKGSLMSMFFNWKMIVPLWTGVVVGLFALIGPPFNVATGAFLAFVVVVPLGVLLVLAKSPPPTLSEVIAQELRPTRPSQDR